MQLLQIEEVLYQLHVETIDIHALDFSFYVKVAVTTNYLQDLMLYSTHFQGSEY